VCAEGVEGYSTVSSKGVTIANKIYILEYRISNKESASVIVFGKNLSIVAPSQFKLIGEKVGYLRISLSTKQLKEIEKEITDELRLRSHW
jgi:hypothetical protein